MPHTQTSDDDPVSGDFAHATPAIDDPNVGWLSDAACGSLPLDQLDLFFVGAGRTIAPDTLAICRACTVRSQCLAHAEQHEITNGYFGGLSPSARQAGTGIPNDETRS